MRRGLRPLLVGLVLAGLVAGVYLQATGFGYVFDDGIYVTGNKPIHQGLTAKAVAWAFSSLYAGFWHPLTWLSHLLDVSLYGMHPAGHHLSAVVLHAASAVLCFLLLRACTGVTWPAALAAALFAIHPLRAESVAYVSERKDVLSVLLWFLTLATWLRYLRRPSPRRYLAALGVFILGLMAKPMLVTLPFALLLLDFWPFDRVGRPGARPVARLILEKLPLLALSLVVTALNVAAEKIYGALSPVEPFPLGVRLLNVVYSYGWYLAKTVWPSSLGAFYPHPGPTLSAWSLLAAAAAIAVVSALALRTILRRPWLAVGWLWFLGTLVPVIGLVQVGDMGRADRFSYLPSVGLSLMACWEIADRVKGRPRRLAIARWAAAAAVMVLAVLTWRQVGFWRDGITLFSRTVAVTGVNPLARYNLAVSLANAGRREEAITELRRILADDPGYIPAYHDLGALLADSGRTPEAVGILAAGLERFPRSPRLHYRLGLVLSDAGDPGAASRFEEALRLRPGYADAHVGLGAVLGNQGRLDEAERHFREALAADPDQESARWNLERLRMLRAGAARGRP